MDHSKDSLMIRKYTILLIFTLLFTHLSWADNTGADDEHTFNVKELKEAGKISSLEDILSKLSGYGINRLLEIELKCSHFQGNSHLLNHQFIYEIEYINDRGIVLEIEVDALTAQVLKIEREY